MTSRVSAEEVASATKVENAEKLFSDIADEIFALMGRIQAGEFALANTAEQHLKQLRAAFLYASNERLQVAKRSKEDAGVVYDYALDFEAARDEICGRLARLRDAGDSR